MVLFGMRSGLSSGEGWDSVLGGRMGKWDRRTSPGSETIRAPGGTGPLINKIPFRRMAPASSFLGHASPSASVRVWLLSLSTTHLKSTHAVVRFSSFSLFIHEPNGTAGIHHTLYYYPLTSRWTTLGWSLLKPLPTSAHRLVLHINHAHSCMGVCFHVPWVNT